MLKVSPNCEILLNSNNNYINTNNNNNTNYFRIGYRMARVGYTDRISLQDVISFSGISVRKKSRLA